VDDRSLQASIEASLVNKWDSLNRGMERIKDISGSRESEGSLKVGRREWACVYHDGGQYLVHCRRGCIFRGKRRKGLE